MPDRKRVPDHRSNVLKGSLPQGPAANSMNTEDLRRSEEGERQSRDEAAQRGVDELYQTQCGSRRELFCTESPTEHSKKREASKSRVRISTVYSTVRLRSATKATGCKRCIYNTCYSVQTHN